MADAEEPAYGKVTRAGLLVQPVAQAGGPGDGAGIAGSVQVGGDLGQNAVPLLPLGDGDGLGREVGPDAVLQVEGEVRVGREVGVPACRTAGGAAAETGAADGTAEEDLDPSVPAGSAAGRGDGDDPIADAGCWGRPDGRGHLRVHEALLS
ncbi:hypothetical protein ACWECC_05060 [Streptomyces microflavus]